MRYILITLILWFSAGEHISAQDYWFKTYDHGPITDLIQNLYLIEDTLYVMGGTGFEDPSLRWGTAQWVIDVDGTSLRRSTYPAMDHNKYSIWYDEQQHYFVITGVDSSDRDHISVIHRDGRLLVHNDSIDIVPENSVIEIPHSLVRYQDQYVTAGVFRQQEPVQFGGFVTYFNEDFALDTAIVFRDSFQFAGRLIVDEDDLICALSARRGPVTNDHIHLVRINRQKSVQFEDMRYLQEQLSGISFFMYMHHEGENRLYSISVGPGTPTGDRVEVRRIDADFSNVIVRSEADWLYNLRSFNPQDLIELSDGNLLLVGLATFSDTLSSDRTECPIAAKFTPDGELLWQQMYLYLQPADSSKILGGFVTAVENDDGDLYFLGAHYSDMNIPVPKPFLMKTDSRGCLEPDCLGYNILSSTERIPSTISDHITLYPNPTSSHIQVSYDFKQYAIYGSSGQLMTSGEDYRADQSLSLDALAPGVYIFVGYDKEGRLWAEQVVVR